MPDALSKTIPIWCCVLNRVLFPEKTGCHELYTPPQVVSESENVQIRRSIDGFVQSLLALSLDLTLFRSRVIKPLRPIWITPESQITETTVIFHDFHPLICCTASRRVTGGEYSEGGYIQGSGDDTEHWAFGLTPQLFWKNSDILLKMPESEVPETVPRLVSEAGPASEDISGVSPISPTTSLFVLSSQAMTTLPLNLHSLSISLSAEKGEAEVWQTSPNHLMARVGPHKIGSKNLRALLPTIVESFRVRLSQIREDLGTWKLIVGCSTGKDHSVGIALAILCLLYDDDGHLVPITSGFAKGYVNKALVKRRLGWIMTSMPDANPSRSTLQSVNSFLMERPD